MATGPLVLAGGEAWGRRRWCWRRGEQYCWRRLLSTQCQHFVRSSRRIVRDIDAPSLAAVSGVYVLAFFLCRITATEHSNTKKNKVRAKENS